MRECCLRHRLRDRENQGMHREAADPPLEPRVKSSSTDTWRPEGDSAWSDLSRALSRQSTCRGTGPAGQSVRPQDGHQSADTPPPSLSTHLHLRLPGEWSPKDATRHPSSRASQETKVGQAWTLPLLKVLSSH